MFYAPVVSWDILWCGAVRLSASLSSAGYAMTSNNWNYFIFGPHIYWGTSLDAIKFQCLLNFSTFLNYAYWESTVHYVLNRNQTSASRLINMTQINYCHIFSIIILPCYRGSVDAVFRRLRLIFVLYITYKNSMIELDWVSGEILPLSVHPSICLSLH